MHPRPSADTMSRCIEELVTLERLFWDSVRTSETLSNGQSMNSWMSQHHDDNNSRPYNTSSRNHRGNYNNHHNHNTNTLPSHSHSSIDKNSELGVYLENKHKQSMFSLDKHLNYSGSSSSSGSSNSDNSVYGLLSVDSSSDNSRSNGNSSRSMTTRSINVNEVRAKRDRGELQNFDMDLNSATDLLLTFANQSHDEADSKRKIRNSGNTNNENQVNMDKQEEEKGEKEDIQIQKYTCSNVNNKDNYDDNYNGNHVNSKKRLRMDDEKSENNKSDNFIKIHVNKEDVMHRVNSGEFSSHTSEMSMESVGARSIEGEGEGYKSINGSVTGNTISDSIEFTIGFGDKMASCNSANDHGAHTDCDETSV